MSEVNEPQWVPIQIGQYIRTEAIPMADGCLVRVAESVDILATESSVFVPNSMIVNGAVVARPTRMQLSESLYVVISELASISLRANELVLTLRCGKEISVTEDIHDVLDKILRES